VTVSQRRYLQTYRHVAFVLQLLSGVATTATFIRISEQHHLPPIFLALPSLLFLLTAIGRCLQLNDTNITAIVIGSTTGAIAGFLSSVVTNDEISVVSSQPPTRSETVTFICTLEFLHIPVVVGTVMFSFCLLFTRLPPLTLVIIAAAIAACGTVMLGIVLLLITDPMIGGFSGSQEFSIVSHSAILLEAFLGIFILALMPALRSNKRAWLICIACLTVSSHWQSSFLDSVQWHWEKSYFPIPGSLFAIIVLFMVEIVEMSETADLTVRRSLGRPTFTEDSNTVFTAIMWHIGAYVIERTSLTIILDSRRRSSKHGHRPQGSDAWLSCLGMLGLLGLLSPSASRHFSLLDRVISISLGLVLYVCMTATSDALANGYFLDDVLGLAVLVTIASSDFASGSVM